MRSYGSLCCRGTHSGNQIGESPTADDFEDYSQAEPHAAAVPAPAGPKKHIEQAVDICMRHAARTQLPLDCVAWRLGS